MYTDSGLIRAAHTEIGEAFNLTPEEMNQAAIQLAVRTRPYYDHLGGVGPDEIQDINQYSNQDLLRRAGSDPDSGPDSPDYVPASSGRYPPDDLVYVTTL